MRNLVIILVLFGFIDNVKSQNDWLYLKPNLKRTGIIGEAQYKVKIQKDSSDIKIYNLVDVNSGCSCDTIGYFSTQNISKRTGDFILYSNNGNISTKGKYLKGKKSGHWINYYDNGYLESEGDYIKGKEEGKWNYYRISGSLSSIEIYKNGKAIKKDYLDDNGIRQMNSDTIDRLPVFVLDDIKYSKFREFVKSNINPDYALRNNIQGAVYVVFCIEIDGTLTNIRIKQGIDKVINSEVLRVIQLSPKWLPGIEHNRLEKRTFIIPVVF